MLAGSVEEQDAFAGEDQGLATPHPVCLELIRLGVVGFRVLGFWGFRAFRVQGKVGFRKA